MSAAAFDLELAMSELQQGAMLLVPNNRLRKALLEAISEQSDQVVMRCPKVEAVDVWVRMTWQALAQRGIEPFCSTYVLDGMQEQLLWTRIVEESMTTFPLLNPQETANALSHAYQLMKQWQIDSPDASRLEEFIGIADIAAFLYWRGKFQILCEQQNCANLVDAVARLSAYLQEHPVTDRVQLINFYQPPPLYRGLFATFANLTPYETVSDTQWQIDHLDDLARIEFPDADNEVQACANWAADKLRAKPTETVSIVCAAKEAYESAIQLALRDALDSQSLVNFEQDRKFISDSKTQPLNQTALVKDALLLLGLNNDEQQADDLCRMLRSPYVVDAQSEREARLHMEQYMRRHFSKRVSWQLFGEVLNREEQGYSCPSLAKALLQMRTILRSAQKQQSSAEWSRLFSELLTTAGWPGDRLSTRERSVMKQWQQALEQFADASALLGKLSAAKAVEKLRSFCQQSGTQQATTSAAIQFYSPTEAAGLSFDHLWLLGFTDQNWPASSSPTPFLPYELQKKFDLPGSHSEVQYQAARSILLVLANSTRQSLVASHALSDGDQEFRASSLTLELADATQADALPMGLNRYFAANAELPKLKAVSDAALPPLNESDPITGGHGIISDQSACPFRAFANHRLKIRQLDDFQSGLNARDRGSAIHEALEFLYGKVSDLASLQVLSDEQRQSLCEDSAQVAVDFLYRKHRDVMTVRFRELEKQRIAELLSGFLERELERGEFTVTANEATIKWQHRALQLNLRIDRIDQLADGSLAIIDYKTGKKTASPASWLLERSEDMQLPVYAVASGGNFTEAVSTLALAHINVAGTDYTGLAQSSNFHRSVMPVEQLQKNELNWEELNEFFTANVGRLADDFVNGVTLVDPINDRSTCTFCGLESLCRINEKRRAAGRVASDEEPGSDD